MATVKICIPVVEDVQPHCQEALDALMREVESQYKHIVTVEKMKSCYLYSSRNFLIGGSWCEPLACAMADTYDFYWFIDSDISGFDFKLLEKMIDMGKSVITVPYQPKIPDGAYVCGMMDLREGIFPQYPPISVKNIHKYYRCDWSGLGCSFFHKSIFTRVLPFPWFYPRVLEYTRGGLSYKEVVGEDIAISRNLYFAGKYFNMLLYPLVHKIG